MNAADPEVPPIGDFYAEVARKAAHGGDLELARSLQTRARSLACSEPIHTLGTGLAYDELCEPGVGEQALTLARAEAPALDEPLLLSAFAEGLEAGDPARAETLHDEAMTLAAARMENVTAVAVPRALLRRELGRAPDASDALAFEALDALHAVAFSPDARLLEAADAAQLFVARGDIERAVELWPDDCAEAGLDQPDQFPGLERLCTRLQDARPGPVWLQRMDVDLMLEHGVTPATEPTNFPDAFVIALDQTSPPSTWPPGRNDSCWCGSGRKYKRCCLA